MIVLNKVSKTYVSKKGVKTAALNGISLKLPNTGVIFIVGKSGAGKSTLLNVLGGLDYIDSGEIIVNGKSTKDFTKSEYDSYRNTYVGFVFQECYMLEKLTVGENIALAIKLQNKKPDNHDIVTILSQVGLEGYIARRTNELSGGELQRVAIARALIKKPQIIIADEPTGALDSNTGTQIFETLKKLANDHLVLVVSHELEFAEQYADRIIEIKDGNVISDMTRTGSTKVKKSKKNNSNISFKDGEISVDPKHKLTVSDIAFINNLIKNNSGKTEETHAKTNKKSPFTPTREVPEAGEAKPLNLIKSKLPLKDAIRMSLNALKHKKFKLVMSILLSVISFTTLGLSSTLSTFNDPANVYSETFASSVINFARVEKILIDDEQGIVADGVMGIEDQTRFKKAIGLNFAILNTINMSIDHFPASVKTDPHHLTNFTNKAYVPVANFKDANIKSMIYDEPTDLKTYENEDVHEVAITKHVYEMFKKYKYYDWTQRDPDPVIKTINKPEDMLDLHLTYYDEKEPGPSHQIQFTIKDVYDTHFEYDDPFFDEFWAEKNPERLSDTKGYQEYEDFERSFGNALFMSKDDFPEKIVPDQRSRFSSLIVGIPKKTKQLTKNIYSFTQKEHPLTRQDKHDHGDFSYVKYRVIDSVSHNVSMAIEDTETFRYLFLLVGGAFAIFSGLLLANFIASSISYQRKEIGILRAIGARGTDVLKIYSAESFFIAFTNFLLSMLFTVLVFNGLFAEGLLLLTNGIPIFTFSYIQILILLGISFLSAFLATFIPIRRIAKQKPIDTVRLK